MTFQKKVGYRLAILTFGSAIALCACSSTDGIGFSGNECPEDRSAGCEIVCQGGVADPTDACYQEGEENAEVRKLAGEDHQICAPGDTSQDGVHHAARQLKGFIPICVPQPSKKFQSVKTKIDSSSSSGSGFEI